MRIVGIIPARLAATRLPDKPLLDLGGKPMIQRVWERAKLARCLDDVLVATPDEKIVQAVKAFGGSVSLTSPDCRSGTDRLAEAAGALHADIVVNIQGDEPLIEPDSICRSVEPLVEDAALGMTSLMCPCPLEELDSPATVKVVCDMAGYALYFSRARIPFVRDAPATVMQHVGLYAYRRDFLLKYAALPQTPLEMSEGLEQLRVLEHGHRIRMVRIERAPLSVDTPDDLERMRRLIV